MSLITVLYVMDKLCSTHIAGISTVCWLCFLYKQQTTNTVPPSGLSPLPYLCLSLSIMPGGGVSLIKCNTCIIELCKFNHLVQLAITILVSLMIIRSLVPGGGGGGGRGRGV